MLYGQTKWLDLPSYLTRCSSEMPSPSSAQIHHTTPLPTALSPRNSVTQNGNSGTITRDEGLSANQDGMPFQEAKQTAKAVMLASTLPNHAAQQGQALLDKHRLPTVRDATSNGVVQTRKRSRSGTRILQTSNPSDKPDGSRQHKLTLQQYWNREQIHTSWTIEGLRARQVDVMNVVSDERSKAGGTKDGQNGPPKPRAKQKEPNLSRHGNAKPHVSERVLKIIYPLQRRRPGNRKTRELRIAKKDLATQSEQLDELVPIRLDIEWDKIRLRDTFTWNLHDRVVSPKLFSEKMVEDLNLPLDQCGTLVQKICSSIEEQIQDFHPQIFIDEGALVPHLPYYAYKDDEMRIVVKLHITIGKHTLVDQFEWEINNPLNSAEDFARQMTQDLSLPGEFTTAIAHSIREQSQLFTRGLYVTGHPFDGRPVEDQELRAGFLPSPMQSPFRAHQAAKEFSPYLYELNEAELEKSEISLSRDERRQKRSVTRRGGPALPDLKDRRWTVRTLIVSSVLPGAAETIEDSKIFKRVATVPGKIRRSGLGHKDSLEDSEDSESEGSSVESPALTSHISTGTARIRGMRTAATVAQVAMRGNLGRSATPEVSALHRHETRTSGRRFGEKDYREDSVDESPKYIIKLIIPRERLAKLFGDQKSTSKSEPLHSTSSTSLPSHRRSQSGTPGVGTPAAGTMGPPPSTPNNQQSATPRNPSGLGQLRENQPGAAGSLSHPHPAQLGRVDAKGPPSQENPIVR